MSGLAALLLVLTGLYFAGVAYAGMTFKEFVEADLREPLLQGHVQLRKGHTLTLVMTALLWPAVLVGVPLIMNALALYVRHKAKQDAGPKT